MKFILCLGVLLLTSNSYGLNCVDLAAKEVLKDVANTLKVNEKELKVRHIGGESLDGDLQDNIYQNHSGEYFDVFLSSDDASKAKALQMYAVMIYIYSNAKTGETVDCDIYLMEAIESDKWQNIYETYL
jgi:hypothetical protein